MALIVTKFGGTSVASTEKIKAAAQKVAREVALGNQVIVVVSAMSGVTNTLVGYCNDMAEIPDDAEYDTVVSSGEQITSGLMAMALQGIGVNARSWQGWQIPILTDETHTKAIIESIDGSTLQDSLTRRDVIVVPGFQGITAKNRISTLGRGGSDTTAVALAAALKADRCDIYTDVDGVYTTDPRIVPAARKINRISYEEMIELASLGAKVLQTRSVEVAMKNNVVVQVLSSFDEKIGSDLPGTLIVREEDIMETKTVSGVAYQADEAKVTILNVPDVPGLAAKIFEPLAAAAVNVDMIVQNISSDGSSTDMTFTCSHSDLPKAIKALESTDELKNLKFKTATNLAKVSVVGVGMITNHGIASKMFKTLADKNINIEVIATSEIKISVLVKRDYMELAVRALHESFALDAE
jgi:aspartate kinase